MEFSANISEFNVGSLSTVITWNMIKFSPEQKKRYKIQQQIDDFYFTCYLEVKDSIKENIILNNQDFSLYDSELKISYRNGYFEVVFNKDKIEKVKNKPGNRFYNYSFSKELDGFVLIIQIRVKFRESGKGFTSQELNVLKKERRKKINNSKYIKNPYPVKVFRGGACSPK
ncbi:hypothetical protein [Calidifontibacillus oryziterrae]|uniref:hypothetical protein n=1 Tax=Calidifontibacillus oryziterrae TaxID=1191699 RepID=UPI0002FF4783|nr:hypothetical protein [Calidifontibacillus oryziterrae]